MPELWKHPTEQSWCRELDNMLRIVLERAKNASYTARKLAEKYGYLPYMIERYIEMLGQDNVLDLLEANEAPLPETIRCNDYLIDCNKLKNRLEEKGFRLTPIPQFSRYGYRVDYAPISVGATHEYLQGYYYVQGASSMSIVHAMDLPVPGTIIDMAAAPGGKSTQILQITRDKSLLVAVEKNPRRIKSLRSNIQRMRFSNYILLRRDSLSLGFSNLFDSVLLDAPSTGEGIIRKDPRRKKNRNIWDLAEIHELQVKMLKKAIEFAKPNASIVYAACSLAAEEGEFVINRILEEYPNIEIEPHGLIASPAITEYFGFMLDDRIKNCGRYWPHIHGYEGFFVCKLRKKK